MINTQIVGEASGRVWQYLNDHGRCTLAALTKGMAEESDLVCMAAGWLAREGKLEIQQEKRSVYLLLKEA